MLHLRSPDVASAGNKWDEMHRQLKAAMKLHSAMILCSDKHKPKVADDTC